MRSSSWVQRQDVREALQQWIQRVLHEYGTETGQAIIKSFLEECGGRRIRVPDMYDLYRMDRDRIICGKFTGQNHEELAIAFRISVSQVRRIVNGPKK